MTTLTVRTQDATDWHVACNGVVNPWFVVRSIPVDDRGLRTEYAMNAKDNVRRFKTREAAQKVADKLQITADFDDSREHARLAVHHMLRATNHLQPTHPIMETLTRMSDLYLELTGKQL